MIDADLVAWAERHNVPKAALVDLITTLGGRDFSPQLDPDKERPGSEARQQSLIRLEAARLGVWLTRNNVGAFQDPESGRLIRYGLANESKQQNARVKSADLIGFKKTVIVPSDVGKTKAIFTSIECKEEGWVYKGSKREVAQARWRDFVHLSGGYAIFANGPGSLGELQ